MQKNGDHSGSAWFIPKIKSFYSTLSGLDSLRSVFLFILSPFGVSVRCSLLRAIAINPNFALETRTRLLECIYFLRLFWHGNSFPMESFQAKHCGSLFCGSLRCRLFAWRTSEILRRKLLSMTVKFVWG